MARSPDFPGELRALLRLPTRLRPGDHGECLALVVGSCAFLKAIN